MMRQCLLLALALGLSAQEPDLQSRVLEVFAPNKAKSSERNPSTPATHAAPGTTSLVLPRDNGQHLDTHTERYLLRGTLQGPLRGPAFGLQVLFVRQGVSGSWNGSEAWRSDRWWVAQAILLQPSGRRLAVEERIGREGLPASASQEKLDVHVDGWSMTQDGPVLRFKARLSTGTVELELASQLPEVSIPALDNRDLRRALHPHLRAQGQLSLQGHIPLSVQGRFSLLHEWGTFLPDGADGWDQALLHFHDGRTWIMDGLRSAGVSFGANSQIIEVDARGHVTRVGRNPAFTLRKHWTSSGSTGRYPISFQIQGWRDLVGVDPLLEQQEIRPPRPGAAAVYRGFANVQGSRGDILGDAFVEFTGYVSPMRGF